MRNMGNSKTSLCGKTSQATANYTDSYQSTSVSSVNSNVKKSFAQGQISKDSFNILKVIGRGSFGKVFLVEKKPSGNSIEHYMQKTKKSSSDGEYFAMKVLKKTNLLERN